MFEANSSGAITDWGFEDQSILNASAANAVSGGTQFFSDTSALNASAAMAINGGHQVFVDNSTLNASAANAISAGQQDFSNDSILNASAANAVNGGDQYFYDNSILNALVANAVSGGNQQIGGTLNALSADAVSGGNQKISGTLNASAADAISGGIQNFISNGILNATAANAVSGGRQWFNNTNTLNASATHAVSGGNQVFFSSSILNASVANAVSGGVQTFRATSTLNASTANAVSGGTQTFYDDSTLSVGATNALSQTTDVSFNNIVTSVGGTLVLNGYSTVIGRINSVSVGSGRIVNNGATDADLTVDSSLRGNSFFSGVIADSDGSTTGSGTLGLHKTGVGTLTLTGANTYTGDTTVSGGILQFGNGTATAHNILGGDILATAGNLTILTPTTVAVAGKVEMSDGSSLSIGSTLGAAASLTATNMNLGNNVGFNLTGINATSQFEQVLIDTSAGIAGDFANVSIGGFTGAVDYLKITTKKSTDGKQYLATYGLAWAAHNNLAHGTFTLVNASDTFTVGATLADQAANPVTGWDGKTLTKQGSGTLALTGANTYTGDTTVSGGTLRVDGSIASSSMTTIANGATLVGGGTLGNTFIASGATLAPGGVGTTLTVDGDLTIASGTTYQVYADPSSAQSTLVKVTGAALLQGGTVKHVGPNGTYVSGIDYTILTADNGVTGTFADVDSDYAYLRPILTYTPTTVTMELKRMDIVPPRPPEPPGPPGTQPPETRPIRFADAVNTGNQKATADALESLNRNDSLYQFIETLPSGAPPAVFDNLSGEIHATAKAALQSSATGTRTLTFKHLRNNLTANMPTAQAGAGDASTLASSLPQDGTLPIWTEIVGNWQTLDGDNNAARATQRTGGLFVGSDHAVGNGWRVGGALGYTDSTLRVNDRNSKARIDSYSATLYGGKAFEVGTGKLNLLMGTAYSWHNIDTERHATVSGASQKLKADYRANTTQFFTELGYAMPVGNATLEPFVGVAWSKLQTRGFSESGGSAALSGRSQSDDQTTTTLGLRAQTPFSVGTTNGTVRGTVGWRHAFGNLIPQSTLAFNGSQPFTVTGTPIARDAALLELGADIAIARNATLGVSYSGQFGNGSRENTGSVNMRWKF